MGHLFLLYILSFEGVFFGGSGFSCFFASSSSSPGFSSSFLKNAATCSTGSTSPSGGSVPTGLNVL